MCGIAGFLGLGPDLRGENEVHAVLARMSVALAHRGPDDSGAWVDLDRQIALVHRRLSIIDTSATGHQPMRSASGRYVIVYNGEIYNHREIRAQVLKASPTTRFRGHSDTEVLLAAIDLWGDLETLRRCNGMFAFALFDQKENCLHLARDRVGEKPLYYGFARNAFVFGSELRALWCHPDCSFRLDHDALWMYLREGFVPAPRSIAAGFSKLLPGTRLSISLADLASRSTQVTAYWSAIERMASCTEERHPVDEQAAIASLEELLRDSVRIRMEADVPLGAFLSGGIDSSAVVALMQAQATRPVKTFTIGSPDRRFDEAAYAKAVAGHLGTDHTELYVTSKEVLDTVPLLPQIYDEPFADSSQIPTYLISKLARTHVTVSLSGDGGDELFGGYDRYARATRLWRTMRWIPLIVRDSLGALSTAVPVSAWNRIGNLLPERYTDRRFGDRLHKAVVGLRLNSFDAMYQLLLSVCPDPTGLLTTRVAHEALMPPPLEARLPTERLARMMTWDFLRYLPDDILVKVDRASMAVSLEGRIPLLDHRIVEFAWRLPEHLKVRDGVTKWLLRQVLYKYVPRHLIERPKMGFGVPLDTWLRADLREWAGDLLASDTLQREGIFNARIVHKRLQEHLSGERSWASQLWTILMFRGWKETMSSMSEQHAPQLMAGPSEARTADAGVPRVGRAY